MVNMLTNADMTIYNKYVDPATRSEKYARTVIVGVVWQAKKAVYMANVGMIAANSVAVFVPFACRANYLDPHAWQALSNKAGKWTLQAGDVIVKGIVADVVDDADFTMTDLRSRHENVLTIQSVDTMDQGSESIRHWAIGAK